MAQTQISGRTYNQNHIPRKYSPAQRRMTVYWAWSYPFEVNRDVRELDNRYSTMTEVRRVAWPAYETEQWNMRNFLQGIDGTLELFHRSLVEFQRVAGEASGQPVAVYQRIDQAGYAQPIDERVLADTDTLFVFGLDHIVSEQAASPEEIRAIRDWLKREGTCLLIAPHHDVGFSSSMEERQMEYKHHGDELVPRQQRFGLYTRTLLQAFDIPVINKYGMHPATVKGQLAPLTTFRDLDKLGLLNGVTTFNYHPHLPHYQVTENGNNVHVLARQPIDMSRPHPFTQDGNREFNSFLWVPPKGERAGNILIADSTIFTTLFGVSESLVNFWKNLATMAQ